jgi:hypothetical protein
MDGMWTQNTFLRVFMIHNYLNTIGSLAALTLIILFSEMLKNSKNKKRNVPRYSIF